VSEAPGAVASHPAPGLTIYQPPRGFRYSLDPFLLAGFVLEGGAPASALDVGTGSGVLALVLARAGVGEVHGVDVRPEWAPLQRASAAASGLSVRWQTADVRDLHGPRVACCVSNPPYFSPGGGPVSPDPVRAHARHALAGDLDELVPAMARLAPRVALVLPAARGGEAARLLEACGRPVRRRLVLGDRLVLLEGGGEGPRSDEAAPLYSPGEGFSARVHTLYTHAGVALAKGPEGNT
jgi:tRNA1Val (adenine37-N6)-methyltransferase